MLSATLALLMQVGPNPGAGSIPTVPEELVELRRRQQETAIEPTLTRDRLQSCLARAEQDSVAARIEADSWLRNAVGVTRAEALQCRGYAFANSAFWNEAASSFIAARDDSEAVDSRYRARLGTMAANALLTAGDNRRAIEVLETAKSDAAEAGFAALEAEIELDRARAYVALGEPASAGAALAAARELAPANARAWLLSATLARRNNDLATAQSQIEQASRLNPTDPEIGLEAGVIAVLAGNDDAARQSWQSIVAIAPESSQAKTAKSYLEQLDRP
ncbi:tetratricopeptide repeat protein [Pontixanthobacter aquaemixtae]|uniref:PEP-CTERM system TPR-repeat lipoprotein n=1 Tax=Pontixanthobacter aquaemixtae TaxID=1958940 RepID=A0A844ZXS0_9SPHN|nr:tetratricopeptide repeat protein [Pontixanthobacter aquaemixtae]MXO91547.1 hypothetical protein [Pontixanthobacter aquaemixtae]